MCVYVCKKCMCVCVCDLQSLNPYLITASESVSTWHLSSITSPITFSQFLKKGKLCKLHAHTEMKTYTHTHTHTKYYMRSPLPRPCNRRTGFPPRGTTSARNLRRIFLHATGDVLLTKRTVRHGCTHSLSSWRLLSSTGSLLYLHSPPCWRHTGPAPDD